MPRATAPAPLALRWTQFLLDRWRTVETVAARAGLPVPRPSLALGAKIVLDEVLVATMLRSMRLPSALEQQRIARELRAAVALWEERGWVREPRAYHADPAPLDRPRARLRHLAGVRLLHVTFESGYEPHPGEPGRDRWLNYRGPRTAHAWVLRHEDRPRPWLVCIHGYGMGYPLTDLAGFQAVRLHRDLGLNVALPVLPLHGPRRLGERSGERFVEGDHLDTLHAVAQAMWDVRRLLTWIRAAEAPAVGVYGLSLGGYHAALLAALEAGLACVVAGIPATDFLRLARWYAPALALRYPALPQLLRHDAEVVLRVVSPLSLEPQVPRDRRFVFAGLADRFIPPDHVRDLWEHWGRPRVVWYEGGHVTFRRDPGVRRLLDDALGRLLAADADLER